MKTIDSAMIQDLYHYSRAMQGEENLLDLFSLRERLNGAESVHDLLLTLEKENEVSFFQDVIPHRDFDNEKDMIEAGEKLEAKVNEWAKMNHIDPITGEKKCYCEGTFHDDCCPFKVW